MDAKQWQYRRPRPRRFDFPRRGAKSQTAGVAKAVLDRKVPQEAQIFCKVFEHWAELVGPRMAAKSCPALLRRKVLFIDLRDHQWAHDMRYMQKAILGRLSALLGPDTILSLRCRVLAPTNFVSHAQRQDRTQNRRLAWREMNWPAPRPPSLPQSPPSRTQELLQGIQDPTLRNQAIALRRALAKEEDQ